MKFTALLIAFAATAASTFAAECAQTDLKTWAASTEGKAAESACDMDLSSGTIDIDEQKMCANSKCVDAIIAYLKAAPDCTVQGSAIKSKYEQLAEQFKPACDALNAAGSSAIGVSGASAAAVATAAVAFYALA